MTTELFRQYRSHPTRQLRDRIFNHHYKLACSIARQFEVCCDEPIEDLVQLAAMGLLAAIERFEPQRGNAFSSFACLYIKGEICHYLRDKSNPVKIPRTLQSLYQRGGKLYGNDKQIAIALGTTEEKWREAKSACTKRIPYNIDNLIRIVDDDDCGISWLVDKVELSTDAARRLLVKISKLSCDDDIQQETARVEPLPLNVLDQPSRTLIEMFFLEGKSFKEIRQSAIALGIKPKDIKPMIVNACCSVA